MAMIVEIAVPEKIRPVLIKLPEVKKMTGVRSINTLTKRMNESGFPRPLKIDGVNYWIYTEVYLWIQRCIDEARQSTEAVADLHALTVR